MITLEQGRNEAEMRMHLKGERVLHRVLVLGGANLFASAKDFLGGEFNCTQFVPEGLGLTNNRCRRSRSTAFTKPRRGWHVSITRFGIGAFCVQY